MNKEKMWGWVVAFIVGYMTSSAAGKFITENDMDGFTLLIFSRNFIVFFAQLIVIVICYGGIKLNSKSVLTEAMYMIQQIAYG